MELHQPIPYSGYSSQHTLDNSSGLAKVRQPLSDSTGNAQLNTLAATGPVKAPLDPAVLGENLLQGAANQLDHASDQLMRSLGTLDQLPLV